MRITSVAALFSFGLVKGDFGYIQSAIGIVKDDVLFRIVCTLNEIIGRSATNATRFTAIFTKGTSIDNFGLTLIAKTAKSAAFNDYRVLLTDEYVPEVPMVMGYGPGVFTFQSFGEGLTVTTATQAADVDTISLQATGPNVVMCTTVQCEII